MEDRGGLERLVRTNTWRLVVVATATQWHASSHMLTNPPHEHESTTLLPGSRSCRRVARYAASCSCRTLIPCKATWMARSTAILASSGEAIGESSPITPHTAKRQPRERSHSSGARARQAYRYRQGPAWHRRWRSQPWVCRCTQIPA